MVISTRVLKEPRGFIRIIQCILAILAFSTTAGFSTTCTFMHKCTEKSNENITYGFGYPFNVKGDHIVLTEDCQHDENNNHNEEYEATTEGQLPITLPYDFSPSAEFFVATGVLSFLYSIISLIVYIFLHQQYANDSKLPVVDLGITAVLSIFWMAGSSAWAQGVADVKYYLHPDNLMGFFQYYCQILCKTGKNCCETVVDGQYAALNVSLVFGYACFLLWASSLWFVYKETVFHTPVQAAPDTAQNQVKSGNV